MGPTNKAFIQETAVRVPCIKFDFHFAKSHLHCKNVVVSSPTMFFFLNLMKWFCLLHNIKHVFTVTEK